jgi:hypothetical protein
MHQFAKHIRPLAPQTEAKLKSLSNLHLSTYNETDVREAFLAPLIEALGYSRGTDYTVFTEQQYDLNPLFVSVGSKRIKLDYQFAAYRTGFWLLEAKRGLAADSTQPPAITRDMIGQAHFYAHHHEIDCPLFGVSNGWFTNIYDRDAEDPLQAVLSIPQSDLVARFKELYELIGFDQLTFGARPALFPALSERTWDQIRILASLNNPFAVRCLEAAGRDVPAIDPTAADNLKAIFDPAVCA